MHPCLFQYFPSLPIPFDILTSLLIPYHPIPSHSFIPFDSFSSLSSLHHPCPYFPIRHYHFPPLPSIIIPPSLPFFPILFHYLSWLIPSSHFPSLLIFPIRSYLVLFLISSLYFPSLSVTSRSFYPLHPFPSIPSRSVLVIPSHPIPSHPAAELRDRRVMRPSRVKWNVCLAGVGDKGMPTCGRWRQLSG